MLSAVAEEGDASRDARSDAAERSGPSPTPSTASSTHRSRHHSRSSGGRRLLRRGSFKEQLVDASFVPLPIRLGALRSSESSELEFPDTPSKSRRGRSSPGLSSSMERRGINLYDSWRMSSTTLDRLSLQLSFPLVLVCAVGAAPLMEEAVMSMPKACSRIIRNAATAVTLLTREDHGVEAILADWKCDDLAVLLRARQCISALASVPLHIFSNERSLELQQLVLAGQVNSVVHPPYNAHKVESIMSSLAVTTSSAEIMSFDTPSASSSTDERVESPTALALSAAAAAADEEEDEEAAALRIVSDCDVDAPLLPARELDAMASSIGFHPRPVTGRRRSVLAMYREFPSRLRLTRAFHIYKGPVRVGSVGELGRRGGERGYIWNPKGERVEHAFLRLRLEEPWFSLLADEIAGCASFDGFLSALLRQSFDFASSQELHLFRAVSYEVGRCWHVFGRRAAVDDGAAAAAAAAAAAGSSPRAMLTGKDGGSSVGSAYSLLSVSAPEADDGLDADARPLAAVWDYAGQCSGLRWQPQPRQASNDCLSMTIYLPRSDARVPLMMQLYLESTHAAALLVGLSKHGFRSRAQFS